MLQIQVKCQYCHKLARLTTGAEVWPNSPGLGHKKVWKCDRDDAWVGCHEGTESPLGQLADGPLRYARIAAHEAFDPIWKIMASVKRWDRAAARVKTNEWLAAQLGLPVDQCQFGGMTYEVCLKATALCRALKDQLLEKYGVPVPLGAPDFEPI